MAVVVVVLLVGLLGAAAVLIRHNNSKSSKVSTGDSRPSGAKQGGPVSTIAATTTSSTTTSTTAPTTLPTTTSSTLPGPGDPRAAAPGLLCRQLAAQGFDYPAAVAYWQAQGQPQRMDVDGNGRPCETVYPPSAVRAFWHT